MVRYVLKNYKLSNNYLGAAVSYLVIFVGKYFLYSKGFCTNKSCSGMFKYSTLAQLSSAEQAFSFKTNVCSVHNGFAGGDWQTKWL